MEFNTFLNPPKWGLCKPKNDDKIPILFMLVGLPSSGKSTIASKLLDEYATSNQRVESNSFKSLDPTQEAIVEVHKKIKSSLLEGVSVIYDATNIEKNRRAAFLAELKNIPCEKRCICVLTPYEVCLQFNSARLIQVPEEVIKKMYLNWCPPDYSEGFDEISLVFNYGENCNRAKYLPTNLFEGESGIDFMPQDNKHHSLTLGNHCRKAMEYAQEHFPDDYNVHTAALYHDIGKGFTKTNLNSQGVDDGDCHYYQHQCVGAYDVFFYLDTLNKEISNPPVKDIIYVSNLIFFHMHPYTSWKQSEKAKRKCRRKIGEKMFSDIEKLHEADVAAH